MFVGAYVPLTVEGTILVDGVLASCYTSADHDLAHFAMAPSQWFPNKMEMIFGKDNGFSVFAKLVKNLVKWLSPEMLPYKNSNI